MPEYRHGALYVVEDARHAQDLTADLKRIDRRLFFERQVALSGEWVWCVVCELEGDQPPVTLLEWRDESGAPINELSSGILERVARMERDGAALARRMRENNERRRLELDRARDSAYEDMARDMVPRIKGTRSAALHRGQHLRMSRDKRRARGDKT